MTPPAGQPFPPGSHPLQGVTGNTCVHVHTQAPTQAAAGFLIVCVGSAGSTLTLAATVRQPRPKARVHGEVRGLPWSPWGLGWGLPSRTEVPVRGAGRPGRPAGLVVTGLLATNADSPRGCPAEGAPPALPVRVASWLCRAGNWLGCCQAGPLLAPCPVSQAAGQPLRDCSLLGSQWDVGLGQAPPSPGLEQATPGLLRVT